MFSENIALDSSNQIESVLDARDIHPRSVKICWNDLSPTQWIHVIQKNRKSHSICIVKNISFCYT